MFSLEKSSDRRVLSIYINIQRLALKKDGYFGGFQKGSTCGPGQPAKDDPA